MKEYRQYPRTTLQGSDAVLISELNMASRDFIDISENGLAFTYSGWTTWPEEIILMDIIAAGGIYIGGVPAKLVSDVPVKTPRVRRAGFQFGSLSEVQASQIKSYILSQTQSLNELPCSSWAQA